MKKIFSTFLILSMIFLLSVNVFAKTTEVKTDVYFADKKITFEKPIYNIDGRTYFPMRELLNDVGVTDNNIIWDADTKTVTYYANNTIIIFEINSNIQIINGKKVKMDAKPVIINGSTYLPIKYVGESCGYKVSYDEKTRSIHLTK